MKVKEMIKWLELRDGNEIVHVASDEEGNSIMPAREVVMYSDGDWVPCSKEESEIEIKGKGDYHKWVPSGDRLVIFP